VARDLPTPLPGAGEIRVAVRAAGVNFADVLARLGPYPDAPKPPLVVGYEVSGVVDEVGTGVTRVHRGDRVVATVLIHGGGGGGGIGIAAIQLARLRRATIIVTASLAKHVALQALGVDHVIDYRTADVTREVRRITANRGVGVIMDPLGRLVIYGVSSVSRGERRNWWHAARAIMQMRPFKPLSLIIHNRGVFGLNLAHLWSERGQLASAMDLLLQEVSAKRLAPVVAKTFPLERAAEAHRYMQSRSNIGKIVLTV
jgi:NADPH:quinone reductase-like Zn-dependent oxidoreductase